MKFIIFIADIIRIGNYPRVDHFEYSQKFEKYIYLGRKLTAEEFNEAAKRVFSPDFRSQGFTFCPQAFELDLEEEAAEAEAARLAEEAQAALQAEAEDAHAKAVEAEEARIADEVKARREKLEAELVAKAREIADLDGADSAADTAEAERQRLADEAAAAKAEAAATTDKESLTVEDGEQAAPQFRIVDKGVFLGEQRIGTLVGPSKALRLEKEHADLRETVEAWLATNL